MDFIDRFETGRMALPSPAMVESFAAVSDRLELRPNWFVLTIVVLGSIAALLLGAIGWLAMLAASQDGWPMAATGTLLGLSGLAVALRWRLILTIEGFRMRVLWNTRIVPWSAVQSFEADPRGGISWLPRDRPVMPHTAWQWAAAIGMAKNRRMPIFGVSTQDMLATMNAWLNRYSPPVIQPDSSERRVFTVDDQRLLQDAPDLHARLHQLQRRYEAGETVSPAELEGLLSDLARFSPPNEEGTS
jgi:hypothetical protein